MKHWYFLWGLLGCIWTTVQAQNKIESPTTFKEICFYTIDKDGFGDFLTVQKAVKEGQYKPIFAAIRQMRQALKAFEPADRGFELWYISNYTDFEAQVQVAKEATLASLQVYESRLHAEAALYYDHRQFLEHYLAFKTEAFYPTHWFMSQERYFSKGMVERVRRENPEEGYQLFTNSDFYRPFELFNEWAEDEQEDIKSYLDAPTTLLDTTQFIPYSYMTLNRSTASYILQRFNLDDATQDIVLDREIRALRRFLTNVQSGRIYLVARFNHLEIRRMRAVEIHKQRSATLDNSDDQ